MSDILSIEPCELDPHLPVELGHGRWGHPTKGDDGIALLGFRPTDT